MLAPFQVLTNTYIAPVYTPLPYIHTYMHAYIDICIYIYTYIYIHYYIGHCSHIIVCCEQSFIKPYTYTHIYMYSTTIYIRYCIYSADIVSNSETILQHLQMCFCLLTGTRSFTTYMCGRG